MLNKSTILLVDDRASNVLALEKLLERKDRIFLKASSGEEALKQALNKDIDLIILDVQMPAMDGFEVSQILKSNKRTKEIPIIFASAEKKEHKFMMKGFEEGAVDYLFKPLDPEITRAKVSVLLQLQMQKKELVEKNASLERAALLINNSADIIGIIDADTLKFEEVNQAFTYIMGYSSAEIMGTSLEFFLSDEDRVLIRDIKVNGGAKERVSFETRVYCKDRSVKWLQWNVAIKSGKWFVNARDITLIKQVEKIRNYLATIVKQSNDAIYIHDDQGKIISWNKGAEAMYGYREDEALKMKIWSIIPEYLHEEKRQIIDKVLDKQGFQSLEGKRITKHGKVIDILFSVSLIVDPDNNKKSIAITERDITQQKIADERITQLNADLKKNITQLEYSNNELESFSYTISHDLRSPLRAMGGYAEMLLEDYSDKIDDEGKKMIDSIKKNVKKMNALINDLLAFSKLGKQELNKSLVEMSELVSDIVNEFKDSRIHIQIKPLSTAYADSSLLNQVWVNLISNALKYSGRKDKPCVEIGSDEMENEIIFYVRDNGAGFDMAQAHKLFGVFQRLHRADQFEGTGIGLAIVQRVIARHGGRVWAEGKVNEGATFYFSLPSSL